MEHAKAFLRHEKIYGPAYNDKKLLNRYYWCKKVTQRAEKQCSSKAKLVLSTHTSEVDLFHTEAEHDHDDLVVKKKGIVSSTQALLTKLLDQGMKTNQIKLYLYKEGIDLPNDKQIQNFKQQYRKTANGPALTTLADFESWCKRHAVVPGTEDGAYVSKYEVKYPDNDSPGNQCRAFLTTKRLICNAKDAYTLHADETNKLMTTGFPGLVLGTTDASAKFNLIAICVCPGETAEDYEFMFVGFKEAAESYGVQINIT